MAPSSYSPIFITGQTATGKTELALWLAQHISSILPSVKGANLLSVDSKQVYEGMGIVTGKDIPQNFVKVSEHEKNSYFESKNVRIYGVDVIKPNEEWSVAHFVSLAKQVIAETQK